MRLVKIKLILLELITILGEIYNMRSFGFKHFRKFEDFPPIDLGSINVLVGPNNSGKSTFIKALKIMCFNLGRKYKYDFPFYKEFYFNCDIDLDEEMIDLEDEVQVLDKVICYDRIFKGWCRIIDLHILR